MAKTKTISSGGLSMRHKIGYALGDAGGCMTFVVIGKFFQNYCTDVLNVDGGLIAILLLVWNVWDFINDPIMGGLMDKSFARNRNPRGKFRPWLLRSAPLVCITFVLLFALPTMLDGLSALICLFTLKVLYEAAYTMFNIPMGALLSAMSSNNHERASLSSARGIGSGIGSVLPLAIIPTLVDHYGHTSGKGYLIGAAICAGMGLIMSYGHYFMTEERVSQSDALAEEPQDIKLSDILNVFRVNRPFLALCIHGVSICLMQSTSETIESYFYNGVYGGMSLMTIGMAVSAPVMLATFIICPKIAKKTGLDKFIRYGLVIGSAIYLLLFLFHMLFYIDPYVHMVIKGLALGISSMSIYMQWGFVGEAIDYNEMITGKRTEGSIYGTFNLARRVGQTIGASLSMGLLDVFKYDGAIQIQSNFTITGFKIIGMLLPGIFVIGSWVAFKFVWNMNDETRARLAEFKEKQKADAICQTAE